MTVPGAVVLAALAGCGDSTGVDTRAAALELRPSDTLLVLGERTELSLRIFDADGNSIGDGSMASWNVSDPGIVRVEGAGRIEAVGPGAATVTATYGSLSKQAGVRVNPPSLGLSVAGAYLVQSVQRLDGGVPLVEGRAALLRVFLLADGPNFFRPRVRATLHLDGSPVQSFTLEAAAPGVPTEVDQGELGYHVAVPAEWVRPGAELVVEADPAGEVPLAPGSVTRYPAAGRLALDVREVPPFALRIVPVHLTVHQTTGRVDESRVALFLRYVTDRYPLKDAEVDIGPVYSTDARLDTREGWAQLAEEIHMLQLASRSARYHYGAVQLPPGSAAGGWAWGPSRASAGADNDDRTMAHELGHNFHLPHAPCGTQGYDETFPYGDGTIGHFGFNPRTRQLIDPGAYDIMAYCTPSWISDHHYEEALAFRDGRDWEDAPAAEPVVFLRGRIWNGVLALEPLIELSATPLLPAAPGAYRIEGLDAAGAAIFSLSFDPVTFEGSAGRGFLFAVPRARVAPERLARVRLTGPEGTAERSRPAAAAARAEPSLGAEAAGDGTRLEWSGRDYPFAVVRDRRTGRIVGMSRSGTLTVPGYRAEELEVVVSDGIGSAVVESVSRR